VATSTVPAVVTALHRLLVDADWPLRVPSISVGLPRQAEREMVIIGDVSSDQEWASIGTARRDEDYTVDLYVVVLWPGYDQLEALSRAWELYAVVEDVVRDNPGAGGAGVLWSEVKRPSGATSVDDEGYAYQISSGIRTRARI
jgi:hypothetical protein